VRQVDPSGASAHAEIDWRGIGGLSTLIQSSHVKVYRVDGMFRPRRTAECSLIAKWRHGHIGPLLIAAE
jgi:hypothetical protein